jgi:enoyl-CoA hydratase/carnithine racemase
MTQSLASPAAFDEQEPDPSVSVLQLDVTVDAADMPAAAVAAGTEALSTALRDPDIRVIVLGLQPRPAATSPVPQPQPDDLHDWLLALWESDKPTVAALQAPLGGAGLALALACDLLVAGQDVRMHLPPRLQVAGRSAAATWLASRRLPGAAASALALGRELDAARAHALGLVLELTPAGMALERAVEIARGIAAEPADVLRDVRLRLAAGPAQGLSQALADDRARWLRAHA